VISHTNTMFYGLLFYSWMKKRMFSTHTHILIDINCTAYLTLVMNRKKGTEKVECTVPQRLLIDFEFQSSSRSRITSSCLSLLLLYPEFLSLSPVTVSRVPACLSCYCIQSSCLSLLLLYPEFLPVSPITRWRSWLRHCATNRKVAGSILDGVKGIF
jgi:hypothetical protein